MAKRRVVKAQGVGDHPDLADIEAERAALFAKLVAAQDGRDVAAKSYLQCLVTPATACDGSSLTAFDSARKPSDETESWQAMGVSSDVAAGVRCQYYVHVYAGPLGAGFILGCQMVYGGQTWRYEEHHGPEARSGFDGWLEVVSGGE